MTTGPLAKIDPHSHHELPPEPAQQRFTLTLACTDDDGVVTTFGASLYGYRAFRDRLGDLDPLTAELWYAANRLVAEAVSLEYVLSTGEFR
jgi:hypothetical protein